MLSWPHLAGLQYPPCCRKNLVEHGAGQAAGRGVLLARVIRRQEHAPVGQGAELAMPEARPWYWNWHRQVLTGAQVGVKGNAAEGDDHLHVGQQAQLSE